MKLVRGRGSARDPFMEKAGDEVWEDGVRSATPEPDRPAAAPRSQGYSQRDVFEPARQQQRAEKTGQATPADPRADAQQKVQRGQPAEGDEPAQETLTPEFLRKYLRDSWSSCVKMAALRDEHAYLTSRRGEIDLLSRLVHELRKKRSGTFRLAIAA